MNIQETETTLVLTLDNPGRKNALSRAVLQGLKKRISAPEVAKTRLVFLRGVGGLFSAGADVNDLSGTIGDVDYDRLTQEVVDLLGSLEALTIALVEGPCIGAAAELALSCDLRIATSEAYIQIPATRLGLLYKPQSIEVLSRRFRPDALIRLLVMAESFDAKEARRLGLFTEVVSNLDERAIQLVGLMKKTEEPAARATRILLRELATGESDPARWNDEYRTRLSSDGRRASIEALKQNLAGTTNKQQDAKNEAE